MTDERLERIVGTLLRMGVLVAAAVVLSGGIWWLAVAGQEVPAYQQFHKATPELRQVTALVASLTHPRPETVIQLGLLLLIATPIARVILALVAFALERDRTYVVIALLVLGVLLYSLVFPYGDGDTVHTTGLRKMPMPSISTSTTSFGESLRVAPGVPVKMRSPGSKVTQRLIQLTTVAQSKIKSAVRSF